MKRLLRALVHRGGLRADALTSGESPASATASKLSKSRTARGSRRARRPRPAGDDCPCTGAGRGRFRPVGPSPVKTPVATAIRELREETGLVAHRGRVVAETLDGFPEWRLLFRTRLVVLDDVRGEPWPREPDKTAAWRWCDWWRLPQPLFRLVPAVARRGPRASARPRRSTRPSNLDGTRSARSSASPGALRLLSSELRVENSGPSWSAPLDELLSRATLQRGARGRCVPSRARSRSTRLASAPPTALSRTRAARRARESRFDTSITGYVGSRSLPVSSLPCRSSVPRVRPGLARHRVELAVVVGEPVGAGFLNCAFSICWSNSL